MTIITKFDDKNKGEEALVGVDIESAPNAPPLEADSDSGDKLFLVQKRPRRLSSASVIFLCLAALGVLCMGIIGGIAIFRVYARAQMQRLRYHGFCGVPYGNDALDDDNLLILFNNKIRDLELDGLERAEKLQQILNATNGMENFFREEFDLDLSEEESYAKIDVPDFRDGRAGRFLHDFKSNQTAIIDQNADRCFVMPLDRDTVLPPRNLADVINKMLQGYYNIDTNAIRKNMRVVTPAITDMTDISPKIQAECASMKVYMLEKYTSGVFKRSADSGNTGLFGVFSGHLVHFNIVNIKDANNN